MTPPTHPTSDGSLLVVKDYAAEGRTYILGGGDDGIGEAVLGCHGAHLRPCTNMHTLGKPFLHIMVWQALQRLRRAHGTSYNYRPVLPVLPRTAPYCRSEVNVLLQHNTFMVCSPCREDRRHHCCRCRCTPLMGRRCL